jgi:hypothetical protein
MSAEDSSDDRPDDRRDQPGKQKRSRHSSQTLAKRRGPHTDRATGTQVIDFSDADRAVRHTPETAFGSDVVSDLENPPYLGASHIESDSPTRVDVYHRAKHDLITPLVDLKPLDDSLDRILAIK